MIRDLRRLVLAACIIVLAVGSYATFRIWQQGERDERRPAGALVVLGAAEYNGRPSPVLAARLDHAITLFKTGDYRYFFVTGGKAAGDRTTEAAAARAYAVARGVDGARILEEDGGRTTLESLEAVATTLRSHGIDDAVFVSDRSHMLRVLRMAKDLGIAGWGSPTSTSPADVGLENRASAYAHELGALAYYFILGAAPEGEFDQPR